MATKTISLELDAYEKLRSAKRDERESFSSVVRRGHWDDEKYLGKNILASLERFYKEHPQGVLTPAAARALKRRVANRPGRKKTRWES